MVEDEHRHALQGLIRDLDEATGGQDVLTRLAEVVAAGPQALAVSSHSRQLTYAQLGAAVSDLARRLQGEPTSPTTPTHPPAPIALLADQGVSTAVGMFAVMATGAPVVILDPLLPVDRLVTLTSMAGVTRILTDDTSAATAAEVAAARPDGLIVEALTVTVPDGDAATHLASVRALAAHTAQLLPDDLAPASIIFTSGSTGQPKGVVLTHRTVLAGSFISAQRLHLFADDRIALVLPHAFAAGQEVAFMALLNGASLHAYDPRTRGMRGVPSWLRQEAVTTLHGTPSLVRAIVGGLALDEVLDAVRLVTTCGEAAYGRDVHAARRHLRPDAVFTSWLGSSETGQIAYLEIGAADPVPDGALPAGTPAPLKDVTIRDEDGQVLPTGQVGALTVTSPALSGGYWRDPDRTAEKFHHLDHPTGDDSGVGLVSYATGDRGWLDEAGVLHVAGRADDAVKIRGYLVEPADVETALLALPGVEQAVVRGRHLPGQGASAPLTLIGWVVPDPRVGAPSLASMRKALRAALPEWMVPGALVLITVLPLTERGKLDASRLPDPPPRRTPRPGRSDAESRVGAIWADVLHLEAVDPDESFAELGGDSLAIEEMLARLRETLGVALTLADLAEHPTLAEFAQVVADQVPGRRRPDRRPGDLAPTTLRFPSAGRGVPAFCFAGNASHAAVFSELATELGRERPVYGFQVNGLTNRGLLDWTVRANAARHLRDLQTLAPAGPVVLIGHSLGGLIALEAAHQLRERGRDVALVVLIDTFLPPRHGGHVGDWDELARHRDAEAGSGGALASESGTDPSKDPSRSPLRLLLRTLRRQEPRVLRDRLMLLGAGPLAYPTATAEAVMWQHGIWLGRTARISPWDGRSLLYVSEENRDPLRVWDRLLTGPHDVISVRGDHLGLLRPPFLAEVLASLRPSLDAVDARATTADPTGAKIA